ncbi:MAG: N utilization substance protein B-like protein [Parcubacteria group bacterium GW2011_GWC2_40_31]|nr:MAG: N utilization substance protein B-like protein [Parcubacteria group bacterium GW2011_GWF2_40_10]KKR46627.1 MAG: N utilization substance protein B-like protein [Parcubacteria group bacterium GW2011_GWA2_40_143]KKR59011.1 MAG: N utilization substance protein B-like protein [Parcubacteria group bacterium GW2011_GWC2_40_31]KKR75664.1 MAG: N utilization substance protein B-like protein [Parcubacteria group bacterium GW2011_GWE2_40_8]
MANRHLSRSVALQSLFEWDFNEQEKPDKNIKEIVERNLENFAPGMMDTDFTHSLIDGVVSKRKYLDTIIEKAAPEWPISQIAAVDRNVLRIGLFELIYGDKKNVPYKVAINEAIELAKTFGGDSSGKFINGVLGTVYREMGEPEDGSNKDPVEEKLAGAVVYRKDGKKFLFAMVHDVFGYWTLSKGKTEENEIPEDGATRKVKEEIGLDIKIKKELGSNDYLASDPERGKVKKIVSYFLAETEDSELKLKETGGLNDLKWFELKDIIDLNMYDDIREIMAKGIKALTHKSKK